MSKSLVGKRGGNRVVLWGRVCARGFDAALVTFVLFLIVTCVMGASTDVTFFETWWGRHLLILLPGFLVLGVLAAALLPMLRWLRLPLDRLPNLDALSIDAGSEDRSGRHIPRRGVVALLPIIGIPLLVGLFYLEENWRGQRAWNQYLRQQEARGERLDRASLVPPPVPEDQNFASTPFLAPLFDYVPGTQRPRDKDAVEGAKSISLRYDAAASLVPQRKLARSNSWVTAAIDLPAWYAALLAVTNASASKDDAFRARYGLLANQAGAALPQPSGTNSDLLTNSPTLAEAATGVLAGLAESDPVLEELHAASRRPYSRFNLRYDIDDPSAILLPHYGTLKRLCQILQLRASAELAVGRTDQAFDDINLMFRLTDAIRDEPFLISHLVRIAEFQIALQPLAEGLARHQWSDAQLRAFEQRLLQFDFLADGRRALEGGERVFFGGGFIDYLRRSPNRYRAMRMDSSFDWPAALWTAAPSGWFYLEKLNYTRLFQESLLPAIDMPDRRVSPDECRKTEEHLTAMFSKPWPVRVLRHQVFCGLLLPSLAGAVQKSAFAQTAADAAALACALERYRLARGQFPDSLSTLVPEFIIQLPRDVINGQALNYHHATDGQCLLYSVGWNKTDDGGTIALTPNGSSIDRRSGDWVWRLPPGPGTIPNQQKGEQDRARSP